MQKHKVIIVDDEEPARHLLRQYLSDYAELVIIAECSNGEEAVLLIDKLEPDLIYLDIQMPLLNGFQVIQKIIHIPKIIFTTAYDRFALKAFEVNAIDYLLKPYTEERFRQATVKCLNTAGWRDIVQLSDHLQNETEFYSRLLIEHLGKLIAIQVTDIIHIEASGDYSKIHTNAPHPYLSSYGISKLEQKLSPKQFIRIHRSEIINITAIKEVYKDGNGGYDIILINDKKTKVSRGYAEKIKNIAI